MKGCFILILTGILLALPNLSSVAAPLVDKQQISSVEERRILASLEEEYKKLVDREAELDSREMQLNTLAAEVNKRLAAMQDLRTELVKLLNRKDQMEKRRIGKLSAMYGKMEPAKAARLIKELDKQLAVELLLGVKKKTAGEILNHLDPEFVTELTKAFIEIPGEDQSEY